MDDEPRGASGLPPIEEWWPHLSIGARHEVLEHLRGPLPADARAEIARVTGQAVPAGAELSHIDVGYVETQQQPVD
ncbi:MAG: hypothetical protein J7484_15245 [Microbacterium sp.]|nr:hypothetical protein [Microbacterium sp.]